MFISYLAAVRKI